MATATWANSGGGAWFSAANWNEPNPDGSNMVLHYVPGPTDDVTFNDTGPFTVTYDGIDSVDAIDAAENVTLAVDSGSLTVGAGGGTLGTLDTAAGGASFAITGGSFRIQTAIDNVGTLALDTANSRSSLIIGLQTTTSPVSLTGGGNVTLSDSANNTIFIDNSASLDNVDNTISGAGTITANFTTLTNEAKGVIDATGLVNKLILDVPNVTNKGLIEDTGVAGLQLSTPQISTTISNAGGTIAANGAGSIVDIGGGTAIEGGTLSTSGGGVIHVTDAANGNIFDGTAADGGPLTIAAGSTVQLDDGAGLELIGTTASTGVYVNAGTIALDAGADRTELSGDGGGTTMLTGGGNITLSDSANNLIGGSNSGAIFDNVNNTISGAGAIDSVAGRLTLINEAAGVIDGTGTNNALSVQNIGVTNKGLMEDTGSAGLTIADATITNVGGTIAANGSGTHVDIETNNIGSTTIVGGTLSTTGGGVINVHGNGNTFDGTAADGGPLTIAAGSTAQLDDGAGLDLIGTSTSTGVYVNAGTIALDAGADRTELSGDGGGTTMLTGGGNITLSDSANNLIGGSNSGAIFDNVNNTISGAGAIDSIAGRLMLINEAAGVIDATGTNNALSVQNINVTNKGLMEDTGSAGLTIVNATVTNIGGTIAANGSGTHVDLVDSYIGSTTIVGGTLSTTGGGVINVANSTATFDASQGSVLVKGTIAGAGTLALSGGTTTFAAGTTLTVASLMINGGAEGEITTPLTYAGTLRNNGTIALDATDTLELSGAVNGSGAVAFSPNGPATLQLDATALPNGQSFGNTVGGFAADDVIDLRGLTFAGSATPTYDAQTGVLTVTEGGVTDMLTLTSPSVSGFTLMADAAGGTEIVACFAAGTRIRTPRGDVAIGDAVITASGAERPVRWLGRRTIDCRNHPRPREVRPVGIAAHAFGTNRPSRPLRVSPGHAICVDAVGEALIPAGALVNGSTIAQAEVEAVTYFHVELDSHDILLAENLPAESYLEMRNRGFFEEADVVALHAAPDAAAPSHADFCRPFHGEGPLVEAVRARLDATAAGASERDWAHVA